MARIALIAAAVIGLAVGSDVHAAPRVRGPSPHERAGIAAAVRVVWSEESCCRPTWAKPALYRSALLPPHLHPKVVSVRVSRTKPMFASAAVELWNARGRWTPGTAVVVFKWVGHSENSLHPWDPVAAPTTTFPVACTTATPTGLRELLCPSPWSVLGYRTPRVRPTSGSASHLHSDDLHAVRWRSSLLPAGACGTAHSIRLHNGTAFAHSLVRPWWSVMVAGAGWNAVSYGDLDGDGRDEAALDVVCNNQGGMAAGQLAFASVIFSARGHSLRVLGIVTPRQPLGGTIVHVPIVGRVKIMRGKLIAHEAWYGPSDGTCCASGRARTIWTYEKGSLRPTRTIVERRPSR